ncbi:MAG: hypothetical protein ACXAD7_14030 [Candidatus Kariarchaeaceae archaeon]
MKKEVKPPMLNIRESVFIKIISIVGVLLVIVGAILGLIPVIQMIKSDKVSVVSSVLSMGLITIGMSLLLGSMLTQVVLDEELRKNQLERQNFLSSFRTLFLTIKEDIPRILAMIGAFFIVGGVIIGIRPLSANMPSIKSNYPSGAILSMGLIALGVQLLVVAWILRVNLDTTKLKAIEQKKLLEKKD